MDKFVNLHTHSTYSFTDGVGLPEQYAERAKELGQPAMAITDHGNVSAHYKWYKECKKRGIKPILGCEMYLVKDVESIKQWGKGAYYHITVLAKNNEGYKNLMKLVTKSYEQFYYKPKITFQDLFSHQNGLIVLSGCMSGPIVRELDGQKNETAHEHMKLFLEKIDHFYAEFMPLTFEEGKIAFKNYINFLKDYPQVPWVVTSDCHSFNKEHSIIQEIMLAVQSRGKWKDPDRWKFDQDDLYLRTREELYMDMRTIFPETMWDAAFDNTLKIADMVDFEFPTATPIKYPIPEKEKEQKLRDMCEEGLNKRFLSGKDRLIDVDPKYRTRMEYELDIIIKKNFIDYFLVVADLVKWAKSKNILVGPARGSAAGSLVCYLTEITEVDPLKYDLIFERFIDINREDMPDIDIDFEDVKRPMIKKYLEERYGENKVGTLPVFTTFKGKNTLDSIGNVFDIPFKVIDQLKGLIIERSGGDSRASFTIMDTLDQFEVAREHVKAYPELKYASLMEGQIKNISQHAAGMVIANEPLTDFCAVYKIKDQHVISLDYKDASDIGLLKLDILGLNTLSVIQQTLKIIEKRHKKKIDIYNLPLNNPKTYKGFCDGKLFGVFQFDGQAVNQVCRQIKPKDFGSLSAISALARPGPLNGGTTTAYIKRRNKKESVDYPHEVMKDYTDETYGLVVYQEQVMRTMREVGKMSWKDTAEIRKLISKSQGVEKFDTFKEKFAIGARENGMNEHEIDRMWDSICTFGSWAFNKSHSVSYTIISYWTMWLKMNYPLEFYSSIMALTHMEDKQKKIMKEYKREGYKVLPVDINRSKQHFWIDEDGIRVGFCDIKGIGDVAGQKIAKNQPYQSYRDFQAKLKGKRISTTLAQNLVNLGAFDGLASHYELDLFGEKHHDFEKQEMSFGERWKLCPWDVDFRISDKWDPVLKKYENVFKQHPEPIENMSEKEGFEDVIVWGIVYDKNLKDKIEEALSKGKEAPRMKKGEQPKFLNFILEDDTDFITVRVSTFLFPYIEKLIFEDLREDDVILIKGKMGSGIRMLFANKIVSLRHYDEAAPTEKTAQIKQIPNQTQRRGRYYT